MTQKVKCPYCDFRNTKPKVVNHIDKEHKDMLSKDYTASRSLFNYLNKKEYGSCVICKKPTEWNEDTWKYKRFCSDKCKKEYVKIAKGRMINKYGKEHLLNDSDQQKKMLILKHWDLETKAENTAQLLHQSILQESDWELFLYTGEMESMILMISFLQNTAQR